jgi:predicted enzyme related to lactoylglutathione lyase
MIGTMQTKEMAEFYEKVFERKPDMFENNYYGWQVGECFFTIGEHSEMGGKSKDSGRVMFNLETPDVKKEFERIKELGAEVVKEAYEVGENMWIATFADLDGNYFQLMTPWGEDDK